MRLLFTAIFRTRAGTGVLITAMRIEAIYCVNIGQYQHGNPKLS